MQQTRLDIKLENDAIKDNSLSY